MMDNLWLLFSDLWWTSIWLGLWFWVPFSAVIVALVWAYWRGKPIAYWKLALLGILPLMWIVGFSGGLFWLLDWPKHFTRSPDWIFYPVGFGLLVYLGCAVGLIVYLRGARLFTALFALLNFYFMSYWSLLAIISYSGQSR